MNKIWWQTKKSVGRFYNKVIAWVKHFYFKVTVESLKAASYDDLPVPLKLDQIAKGRDIVVEIGSGHGEVLLANDFKKSIAIGYEIKTRFFKLTRRKIRTRNDIFVFQGNGYESLMLHYNNESISKVLILFPDPWHKKRHNKRRPITADFINMAAQKLKKGGKVIIATDWLDYVDFITDQVKKVTDRYQVSIKPYVPEEYGLPITHFHQKWIRKGRVFNVFELTKK
jgi:tRNA (guanine-N7-)-methyltransferase